jgi:large conductance mechanosensitive channel
MWKEFKEFISRGNLVELGVALVLALAFVTVVTAFTDGIIGGIVGIFLGGAGFNSLNVVMDDGNVIAFGSFLQAVVNFLIVAFVLFLIVKAYNRAFPKEEATGPTEVELLTEIRDELRQGNPRQV